MNRDWLIRSGGEDVFDGMLRLQDELNRAFDARLGRRGDTFPAINTWMNGDTSIVDAEIPGVDPATVDISVTGDLLTIKGERKADTLADGEFYHRQERGLGAFSRSVQLPFRVQSDQVTATYSKGIVRIQLPRAEEDKVKRITVKAE